MTWELSVGLLRILSLIAKEGRNFQEVVKEICGIVDGPISAEVISLEAEKMVEEALPLAELNPNIVIKYL